MTEVQVNDYIFFIIHVYVPTKSTFKHKTNILIACCEKTRLEKYFQILTGGVVDFAVSLNQKVEMRMFQQKQCVFLC